MEWSAKIDGPTGSVDATDGSAKRRQSMEKAAEGFESFFMSNMLKEMGKTAQFGEKSYTEETEMSIFYEQVGDYLAKRGIGIKEVIMKYLLRKG
jgi:Rod binding domain-containing protein